MKRILDHLWLNHQTKVRFVLVGLWNTIQGFDYVYFTGNNYHLTESRVRHRIRSYSTLEVK